MLLVQHNKTGKRYPIMKPISGYATDNRKDLSGCF